MEANDLRLLFEAINVTAQSKSTEDPDDACLRRFKEKWLFVATLIFIGFAFVVCVLVIFYKKDGAYTGVALNGVIGLASALAGYYARGNQ